MRLSSTPFSNKRRQQQFILNKPVSYPVLERKKIEQAAEGYLQMFSEMYAESQSRSVELTFVLIPEASMVDEQFYQFWLPLFDFREYRKSYNLVFTAVAEKLPVVAPTLNLLHFSDKLSNAYWHIDGHWNEHGNAIVEEIVTNYLHCKEMGADCPGLWATTGMARN